MMGSLYDWRCDDDLDPALTALMDRERHRAGGGGGDSQQGDRRSLPATSCWRRPYSGSFNTFLKPLARLLTLPLAIITLGIAWFFVSILMLYLTQAIVSGFSVHGFWTYVWATIIIWFVNMVLDWFIGTWRQEREQKMRAVA